MHGQLILWTDWQKKAQQKSPFPPTLTFIYPSQASSLAFVMQRSEVGILDYLLVMLTWNSDSFVEMTISIYETIFASSEDLTLLLHLLHLALVLLRHHTLIVQDFTFRANSKLIPARSTMQLTTFNHTLSLPPTGTQMAPEIFDSMIQRWPLLLILMVPTHKMTP